MGVGWVGLHKSLHVVDLPQGSSVYVACTWDLSTWLLSCYKVK